MESVALLLSYAPRRGSFLYSISNITFYGYYSYHVIIETLDMESVWILFISCYISNIRHVMHMHVHVQRHAMNNLRMYVFSMVMPTRFNLGCNQDWIDDLSGCSWLLYHWAMHPWRFLMFIPISNKISYK